MAEPTPSVAARGDSGTASFEDVYERYFAFVWRSLRALGVEPASLDDACQEVFLVVHRRLAGFEKRSSVRTWLYGIVERVAANHRRSFRRKRGVLEPLSDTDAHPGPDPHEGVVRIEATERVQRFIDGLEPGKRAVFVLHVIEQLPAPEVAETLGIPLNTVYSRARSLRDAFRAAMQDGQEPP